MTTVTISLADYEKYKKQEEIIKQQNEQIQYILKGSKSKVVVETKYSDINYSFIELDDIIPEYDKNLKGKVDRLQSTIKELTAYNDRLESVLKDTRSDVAVLQHKNAMLAQNAYRFVLDVISISKSTNIFNIKRSLRMLNNTCDKFVGKSDYKLWIF